MKAKKIILFSIIFLVLGLGLILSFSIKPNNKIINATNPQTIDVFKEKIDTTLNNLSLEEKISQMLIVSYNGQTFTEKMAEDLETNKPGGIILFDNNISNYEQTVQLINKMEETSSIPLFISIDQEGGKVRRLKKLDDVNISQIPAMWDLGKTDDAILSYNVGKVISEELQAFHINMNFAPVLDIVDNENSKFIGSRSFGSSPDNVSKMALALSKGMDDAGIIPVYKHFPGHGSTITDSHFDLPVLEKSKEELLNFDLIPFQEAINNGAQVIMIGHLATPNITNDTTPASLNKKIITDLLKNEMGYKGLVITDALNMQAITNYYSEQEIYEMAINAGVDILLMPSSCNSAINLIKDSLNKGTITIDQINNSVEKILTLKYSHFHNTYPDKSIIGSKEHQEIMAKLNTK